MNIDLSQLVSAEEKHSSALKALRARYTAVLDMHIQETARNAAFVDALSLVSYAQSRNHVWKAQARAFLVWRDTVWEYAQEAFETLDPSQELESNLADLPGKKNGTQFIQNGLRLLLKISVMRNHISLRHTLCICAT